MYHHDSLSIHIIHRAQPVGRLESEINDFFTRGRGNITPLQAGATAAAYPEGSFPIEVPSGVVAGQQLTVNLGEVCLRDQEKIEWMRCEMRICVLNCTGLVFSHVVFKQSKTCYVLSWGCGHVMDLPCCRKAVSLKQYLTPCKSRTFPWAGQYLAFQGIYHLYI